jgi:hypothetical protein
MTLSATSVRLRLFGQLIAERVCTKAIRTDSA